MSNTLPPRSRAAPALKINRGEKVFIDSPILNLIADGLDADMNASLNERFGDELKQIIHG